jgi:hypothetical protein
VLAVVGHGSDLIHVVFKMGLIGLGEGACFQAIFASWIARKQAPTKGRRWAHRERNGEWIARKQAPTKGRHWAHRERNGA